MKSRMVFLLLALLVFLTGCGKKEPERNEIVNWTLPDVASFEKEYASEAAQPPAEKAEIGTQVQKWKPHGVYTYVTGTSGSDGTWSTALFKISSVDYEKKCAVVTYTVKDNLGFARARESGKMAKEEDYFFESGGEKVVGLEERKDGDGTRHVILYLSKQHYLEFSGTEKLDQAKYCFENHSYRLKYEG